MTKPDSVDSYHAALDPKDRDICDLLRTEINRGLPDAQSRFWHAHPVWFLGDNPIVGYSKLKASVRLMFWSGKSFEVPGLEPDGSFKAASARFTEVSQIDTGLLAQWLADSRGIQWVYGNIVKNKGRLDRLS